MSDRDAICAALADDLGCGILGDIEDDVISASYEGGGLIVLAMKSGVRWNLNITKAS